MKYVYLMKSGRDHYKVGIAKDVRKRLSSIQTSNPQKVQLVTCHQYDNAGFVESQLHQKLKKYGSDGGSEWFKLSPDIAIDLAVEINNASIEPPKVTVPISELEQQALEVFRSVGRVSTSLLQRRLSIGYGRAARVIDSLEAKGVVGPYNGNSPRSLIDLEEL